MHPTPVTEPRPANPDELKTELAINSFPAFVEQAWPIVEPGTRLVWNWHLDIICDALERQINVSPLRPTGPTSARISDK